MAPARYWRIVGIDAPGVGDVALARVALFADIDAPGEIAVSLTASTPPAAGTLAALTDGNPATCATWPRAQVAAPSFALWLDVGEPMQVAHAVVELQGGPSVRALVQSLADDGRWSGEMLAGDVDFSRYTSLLMHFDGANNGTVLTEATGKSVTRSGTVTTMTDVARFGASGRFPGTVNGGYLQLANHADFDLSVDDFTIEFWVYLRAWAGASLYGTVLSKRAAGDSHDYTIINNATQFVLQYYNGSIGNQAIVIAEHADIQNQWAHLAVTRNGNVLRTFKNGVLRSTVLLTVPLRNTGTALQIGQSLSYADSWLNANLDELRILKGVALYTENFTPPERPYRYVPQGIGLVAAPRPVRSRVAHSAPMHAFCTPRLGAAQMARDVEFGGGGTLTGVTTLAGQPDAPTKARVSILRLRDKALARQVWSDAATGQWSVSGLDTDRTRYVALAEWPGNPDDSNTEGYLRPVAGVSPITRSGP